MRVLNFVIVALLTMTLVACAAKNPTSSSGGSTAELSGDAKATGARADVLSVLETSFIGSDQYGFQNPGSIQLASRFEGADLVVKRVGSEFSSEVVYELKASVLIKDLPEAIVGEGTVTFSNRNGIVQMLTTATPGGKDGQFGIRAKCLSRNCDRALVVLDEQIIGSEKVTTQKMAMIFKAHKVSNAMEVFWSQPTKVEQFDSGLRLSVAQGLASRKSHPATSEKPAEHPPAGDDPIIDL